MKLSAKYIEYIVHIIGWCSLLLLPLLLNRHGETIDWTRYFCNLFVPAMLLVVFYLNYCVLVPKYFMRRNFSAFVICNFIAVVIICFCINRYMDWSFSFLHHGREMKPHIGPKPMHGFASKMPKPQFFFIVRDVLSIVVSVVAALAIRLSIEWHKLELQRQRNLAEQTEAALKNLKAQISPHFLLNTLNNIYSLIAFNTDKAQEAVLDLAKMLRYQLYETELRVPIQREAEFLDNYVKLMKLRLPDSVRVDYTARITGAGSQLMAPHVLICLVENAFKHGISAKEESCVEILLETTDSGIHFVCRNSNHPKRRDDDKTPGGIGLQQVGLILRTTYAERYAWTYGPAEDNKSYTSELFIYNECL